MQLIPAVKKDKELWREVEGLSSDPLHVYVWWLGQSGFLVQYKGCRLLLDPYLSDSLTRKYHGTNKPHVRMSERVIDPSLLRGIQLITSSHNHTDHLDAETLNPLLANNPSASFIIPEANRTFVANRLGCPVDFPMGMDDGKAVSIPPYEVYGIAASHNEIEKDALGRCVYLGYVIRMGTFTLYHSGDTLLYPGLAEKLKPFQIDLALLPINGNDPSRGVAGNFNGAEAAALAKETNARCVIPCHYHMFTFNSVQPDAFIRECETLQQSYTVLEHGALWMSEIK